MIDFGEEEENREGVARSTNPGYKCKWIFVLEIERNNKHNNRKKCWITSPPHLFKLTLHQKTRKKVRKIGFILTSHNNGHAAASQAGPAQPTWDAFTTINNSGVDQIIIQIESTMLLINGWMDPSTHRQQAQHIYIVSNPSSNYISTTYLTLKMDTYKLHTTKQPTTTEEKQGASK